MTELRAVETQEEDIEALAAKARMARQEKCTQAVSKVLEEHNCHLVVLVRVGDQGVPLSQILNLPAQAVITSK